MDRCDFSGPVRYLCRKARFVSVLICSCRFMSLWWDELESAPLHPWKKKEKYWPVLVLPNSWGALHFRLSNSPTRNTYRYINFIGELGHSVLLCLVHSFVPRRSCSYYRRYRLYIAQHKQSDLAFGTLRREMRQPRILLNPDFGMLDSVIYLTSLHVGITL